MLSINSLEEFILSLNNIPTSDSTEFKNAIQEFLRGAESYGEEKRFRERTSIDLEEAIATSEGLLMYFPGFSLFRRNLVKYYTERGAEGDSQRVSEHREKAIPYLPGFNETRYDSDLFNKYGHFNFEEYLKYLSQELAEFNTANLANFLLFENHFYNYEAEETRISIITKKGRVVNTSKEGNQREIVERIIHSMLEEIEQYKRRVISEFSERKDTSPIEEAIGTILGCREEYNQLVRALDGLLENIPIIVDSVDGEFYPILFREGMKYEIRRYPFRETVLTCNKNLGELKKVPNPEDIKTILTGLDSLIGIQIASNELIRNRGSISPASVEFLKEGVAAGLKPEDVGEAVVFYGEMSATGELDEKDRRGLIDFFTIIKKYDDEWSMLNRYCRGRRIRHVVQAFNPEKFVYVLGNRADDLAAELEQTTNSGERGRIHTQMVSRILEQNALKQLLGMHNYSILMRELLIGTDPESFDTESLFRRLYSADYINGKQLAKVEALYERFKHESGRIPIHEYKQQTTTRNSNFISEINLGDLGNVRTFIKLYKQEGASESDRENAERERFLLEREGRCVLEGCGVRLPLAVKDAETTDYEGIKYNVLLLGFINARSLDDIVNDPSQFTSLNQGVKQRIFSEAVTQLACIHIATPNLEEEGRGKGFGLMAVDSRSDDHNYFMCNLEDQLNRPYNSIYGHSKEILTAIRPLANYLAALSEADGVYYKDANPRNIMVQFTADDLRDVTHIDYELGVKLLGEIDLFKILRNGRGFEKFDTTVDYQADKWGEKRDSAETSVAQTRYLSRDEEQSFIKKYNETRRKTYDEEAKKRFDLAAIHTHIWYVAWFSHKMGEEDMSDRTRRIVGNRANYHLMEAKLMLDHLLHDSGIPYIRTEEDRQNLVDDLNLYGLRRELDQIQLYQKPKTKV